MNEQTDWVEQEANEGMWMPKEAGEEIIGEIVEIEDAGQFGRQLEILTLEGKKYITPSHKVLQARITKARIGNMIRIVFKGEELPKVKGRNPTKIYAVFCKAEPVVEKV